MINRDIQLAHEFVDFIPADIQEGTIYISIAYATATHKCCCGCGNEVVTPFSPTDWKLIFDGRTISLDPSIGNWSFGCKSHYWIRCNKVIWAENWSKERIERERVYDRYLKDGYHQENKQTDFRSRIIGNQIQPSLWAKLRKILKINI